ncbi:hypothetical protein Pcinc_033198 [Petrolisthes cinctipes]|uniref:Uncharacterized protein n=1 Tax=Petrolisthes cinctipes TaxID=88211 RepID=A0AAE1ESS4_PETCI|nr:hypothetical protein Pcinc_033198 [Petrolisthes cinctipes]
MHPGRPSLFLLLQPHPSLSSSFIIRPPPPPPFPPSPPVPPPHIFHVLIFLLFLLTLNSSLLAHRHLLCPTPLPSHPSFSPSTYSYLICPPSHPSSLPFLLVLLLPFHPSFHPPTTVSSVLLPLPSHPSFSPSIPSFLLPSTHNHLYPAPRPFSLPPTNALLSSVAVPPRTPFLPNSTYLLSTHRPSSVSHH